MKKSRFTDRQIMDALIRAEAGSKVLDLCRELGSSVAGFSAGELNTAVWVR